MVMRLVRVTLGGVVTIAACLGLASTSRATGSCGSDLSQATACPFTTSPATLTGSIASSSETDYFVFWARRHTHLTITATDTEDPSCSATLTCGGVSAVPVDNHGDRLGNTFFSQPGNGVADPESYSSTLHQGIWYLEVTGQPNASGAAVPYTLSIDASTTPAVAWPPLCVVPKVRAGVTLRRARVRLKRASRCLPGRVRHVYNRHYRRGHVIRLHPGTGAVEPYRARISIVVSRGRRHRTRHHHHRHR